MRHEALWLAIALTLLVSCAGDDAAMLFSVTPSAGTARGQEEVVVHGWGVEGATEVWFGDREAEIVSATAETITVVTPRSIAGDVAVRVALAERDVELYPAFTYLALDLAFAEAPAHYLPDLTGLDIVDAATWDFDLDGDVDVLAAVYDGASRLLINRGLGEFVDTTADSIPGEQPLTLHGWDAYTEAVVAEDFDRDGDVDVFVCNSGGQLGQLLVNLDGASFRDVSDEAGLADGDPCVAARAVDLDGDGWTDIALVGHDAAAADPYHLRVLLNRVESQQRWFEFAADLEPAGDVEGEAVGATGVSDEGVGATFSLTTEQAHAGHGAGRATYDFTAAAGTAWFGLAPPAVDGAPAAVSLKLLGDGSGHQLGLYVIDAQSEVFTADLGTVGGAGWTPYSATEPASWTPTGGDGVFDPPAVTVGIAITAAAAGSTGDLFLDDVILDGADGRRYRVEGFERPAYLLAWDDDVSSIEGADADGDGDQDLVLSSLLSEDGRFVRLLTNRSSDQESAELWITDSATPALPPIPDPVAQIAAVDADGDGDLDLLAVAQGGQDRLLINDGTGHFFDDSFSAMPVDWSDGSAVATDDLDLDGRPDAVIANWAAVNRLYLNDGGGGFVDATPDMPLYDRHTAQILLLDVDDDGDMDVFEINGEDEPPGLFVSVSSL